MFKLKFHSFPDKLSSVPTRLRGIALHTDVRANGIDELFSRSPRHIKNVPTDAFDRRRGTINQDQPRSLLAFPFPFFFFYVFPGLGLSICQAAAAAAAVSLVPRSSHSQYLHSSGHFSRFIRRDLLLLISSYFSDSILSVR